MGRHVSNVDVDADADADADVDVDVDQSKVLFPYFQTLTKCLEIYGELLLEIIVRTLEIGMGGEKGKPYLVSKRITLLQKSHSRYFILKPLRGVWPSIGSITKLVTEMGPELIILQNDNLIINNKPSHLNLRLNNPIKHTTRQHHFYLFTLFTLIKNIYQKHFYPITLIYQENESFKKLLEQNSRKIDDESLLDSDQDQDQVEDQEIVKLLPINNQSEIKIVTKQKRIKIKCV